MMTLTARALRAAGKLEQAGSGDILKSYKDMHLIAPYALDSVAALVDSGLVLGDNGNIEPEATTTRAQAATLLYRIYTNEM